MVGLQIGNGSLFQELVDQQICMFLQKKEKSLDLFEIRNNFLLIFKSDNLYCKLTICHSQFTHFTIDLCKHLHLGIIDLQSTSYISDFSFESSRFFDLPPIDFFHFCKISP